MNTNSEREHENSEVTLEAVQLAAMTVTRLIGALEDRTADVASVPVRDWEQAPIEVRMGAVGYLCSFIVSAAITAFDGDMSVVANWFQWLVAQHTQLVLNGKTPIVWVEGDE